MTQLEGGRAQRTLTGVEEARLRVHVESCAVCQGRLAQRGERSWRWLTRVPADALATDSPEGSLGLPMVDPVVFGTKQELAAGGMGRISRAVDRRLGREVAVKEVLVHELRDRFLREVQITASLQHPAIVPIYEAGTFPDGTSFYTMRLVSGRTLQDAIAEAATLGDRLRLMVHVRALTDALAYAHAHGVIHRDLKPGNVLVGTFGETVVIDWGLAKRIGAAEDDALPSRSPSPSPDLTGVGSVFGTPCYMSPAQSIGGSTGPVDDVYALGAILYTVLAGKPPYWDAVDHQATTLVAAAVAGPPTPIAALASEAPADLRAIVERAMARDPAARFATAKELADELARFDAGQLLASRAYTSRELFARWLRRRRRGVTLAAVALVAAVLLGVVWTRYQHAADELAIRTHGARVTELYGEVARQAYRIDRDLRRLETALEGLTAAASWSLAGPEPSADAEPVYFDTDFADEHRRPPDFPVPNDTAYRWSVSLEEPVVGVAPGTDRGVALPQIRRLVALRHYMRQLVVEAVGIDPMKVTLAQAAKILRTRASPIVYAYVDLPEGVHVVWPGMANLRPDYDVRTASFYQMSKDKHGKHWGAPYVDSTTDIAGDDLVLPCTEGVWSQRGEFLGVAGVEMTVTKMVDTNMTMATRQVLRASLVDKDGRKVIDTFDANKRFPASGRDEAVAFTAFDLPQVADAIRAGREGVEEAARDGRPTVVTFVRLDTIGWYYVVEVDAGTLGAR